jgi:hypothetical protein
MKALEFKIKNFLELIERKNIDEQQFIYISNVIEKLENYVEYSEILDSNDIESKTLIEAKERKKGLKEIRDFTSDAKKLVVIDPYFLAGSNSSIDEFIEDFKRATHIHQLDYLNILYDKNYGETKQYVSEIKKLSYQNQCRLTLTPSSVFHDRIWIKNSEQAILVGNSFGGIGKVRLSFILELPSQELNYLLKYLQENLLL